jgi:hypothetical protein
VCQLPVRPLHRLKRSPAGWTRGLHFFTGFRKTPAILCGFLTRWSDGQPPAVQDRPGRRRPQDRNPVRVESGYLPRQERSGLAGGREHLRRSGFPLSLTARTGPAWPVVRNRCRPRGQETRGTGRAARGEVCWTLPAGRACHRGGHRWSVRKVNHEPDRASVSSDGATVHPGWQSVQGE